MPESCQTFEVAAAQTSGLVDLVSSRQTGFFECEHLFSVIDLTDGHIDPAVACGRLFRPGFETIP